VTGKYVSLDQPLQLSVPLDPTASLFLMMEVIDIFSNPILFNSNLPLTAPLLIHANKNCSLTYSREQSLHYLRPETLTEWKDFVTAVPSSSEVTLNFTYQATVYT